MSSLCIHQIRPMRTKAARNCAYWGRIQARGAGRAAGNLCLGRASGPARPVRRARPPRPRLSDSIRRSVFFFDGYKTRIFRIRVKP